MASVGIFGGTFNPPHIGHAICAQEAHISLGLDEVIFVPTGSPPHKEMSDEPGRDHRAAMCQELAQEDPAFTVSAIETSREGPSFTIDTLRMLSDQRPGDRIVLILGSDMALSFPSWREPTAILELAELAVAGRSGAYAQEVAATLDTVNAIRSRVHFFAMPRIDISSSFLRTRVRERTSIRHFVSAGVNRYIEERALYRRPRSQKRR